MVEIENKTLKESKIVLTNKSELCICGVEEFISATETAVFLNVCGEEFVIEGKNLTVLNLDTKSGLLELKGEVKSMCFENSKSSNKFSLKNIFKR